MSTKCLHLMFKSLKWIPIGLILLVLTSTDAHAQRGNLDVDDPFSLYYRIMVNSTEGMHSFTIRPMDTPADTVLFGNLPHLHPWRNHAWVMKQLLYKQDGTVGVRNARSYDGLELELITPNMRLTHNSNIPGEINDGSLWQGLGYNQYYTTGIGFKFGKLSGAIRPEYTYNANEYYGISGFRPDASINRRGNPVQFIDTPQRFGRKVDEIRPYDDNYGTWNLGNSYLEYDLGNYAVGASTRAMWAGPALYNPLILSNNAPGFLNGYFETQKPLAVPFATLEARMFWGTLRESLFFDQDSTNNKRFINGFTVTLEPDFLPGVYVGMNRVAYKYFPENGLTLSDMVLAFRPLMEHPVEDYKKLDLGRHWVTMTSFFVRHVLPESGFEWYLERGTNNNRREYRDRILQPQLNGAYTVGFIKKFEMMDSHMLVWNFEHTHLENTDPASYIRFLNGETPHNVNSWYSNYYIRQGYTHKGKVIGAGIGPGSSAQTLQVTWYAPWGFLSGVLGRVAHQNDRLFENYEIYFEEYGRRNGLFRYQDAEMNYGIQGLVFLPFDLELEAGVKYTTRYRFWNTPDLIVNNLNWSIGIRYSIRTFSL